MKRQRRNICVMPRYAGSGLRLRPVVLRMNQGHLLPEGPCGGDDTDLHLRLAHTIIVGLGGMWSDDVSFRRLGGHRRPELELHDGPYVSPAVLLRRQPF